MDTHTHTTPTQHTSHDEGVHDHSRHAVERDCDVLVVGGSAAGLAAALQLARQRRSVIVVDAGEPRNAPATHMHGYLGHDGLAPRDFTAVGRREVRAYGGEVLDGRVLEVTRADDGFRAELAGGHAVTARRVLIAIGLVDELPDIDGIADHWGRGVIHCPFCHGYEVRDQRIIQVITHPMGLHPATLFHQLTETLTVVVHDGVDVDGDELNLLQAAGVEVVHGTATRMVTGGTGQVAGVALEGGRQLDGDVVAVGPRFSVRTAAFRSLGLHPVPHPSGLGEVVETDQTGATGIPGLWAAGNVTDPGQQVLQAAADGSRVGSMLASTLAAEDLRAPRSTSTAAADWDRRYSRELLWSGNPNAALVTELDDVTPGRALDVGAGEGGDVLWLAEHGWDVTANDISAVALDRIQTATSQRGLDVDCLQVDANAPDAFAPGGFDLVTAHYASIPRTADGRGVHNLLDAVAPGGSLLVVSHDLEPMRAPIDTRTDSRPFDPDAYLRVEDVAAALADTGEWTIDTHEQRPRPTGTASDNHHVDDVVLRAHRHAA